MRCGRRLRGEPIPFAGRGSAAPVMDFAPWQEPAPQAPPPPQPVEPMQGQLFDPSQIAPRVVRMPMRDKPAASKPVTGRGKQAVAQPRLFPSQLPPDGVPGDSTIYCDAPVALPLHRVMAAAVDASMVLISLGIFVLILVFSGAAIVLNKATLPMYALAVLVTLTVYRVMWCLANTDTIGMRSCGLRLITFDGMIPDRRQRVQRTVAGYISTMAGTLGLLWSLVDEEKLTWHDHMSKTFPTPAGRKTQPIAW